MAPSNTFLDNEDVRASIIAHDPEMVIKTGRAFGDGEFEIHHDLNRSKEVKVLNTLLKAQATGHSLDSLARHLWGRSDEELQRRLRGHFNPASTFNRSMLDGTVFLVNALGEIEPRNRHSEALRLMQEGRDHMTDQVTRKQEREFKKFGRTMKRAEKVAPDYKAELTEVARGAFEDIGNHTQQGRLALESGQ